MAKPGQVTRRVGLAVALYDPNGRLVGVANGGTKMMALKPGQRKYYTLEFEGVNAEAHKAAKFQIALETR